MDALSLQNMFKLEVYSKLEFDTVSESHVSVPTTTSGERDIANARGNMMLPASPSCFASRLRKFASKKVKVRH